MWTCYATTFNINGGNSSMKTFRLFVCANERKKEKNVELQLAHLVHRHRCQCRRRHSIILANERRKTINFKCRTDESASFKAEFDCDRWECVYAHEKPNAPLEHFVCVWEQTSRRFVFCCWRFSSSSCFYPFFHFYLAKKVDVLVRLRMCARRSPSSTTLLQVTRKQTHVNIYWLNVWAHDLMTNASICQTHTLMTVSVTVQWINDMWYNTVRSGIASSIHSRPVSCDIFY